HWQRVSSAVDRCSCHAKKSIDGRALLGCSEKFVQNQGKNAFALTRPQRRRGCRPSAKWHASEGTIMVKDFAHRCCAILPKMAGIGKVTLAGQVYLLGFWK